MFSKACEYGIKACIFIAEQSVNNRRVSLKEVASSIDSPEAYTSKILQHLCQNNIVRSDKGPLGGFSIPAPILSHLRLSNIVYLIDGDDIYKGCGLGLKRCNEKLPCPVHNKFKVIRSELKEMLESTTILSLVDKLHNGLTFLKR